MLTLSFLGSFAVPLYPCLLSYFWKFKKIYTFFLINFEQYVLIL